MIGCHFKTRDTAECIALPGSELSIGKALTIPFNGDTAECIALPGSELSIGRALTIPFNGDTAKCITLPGSELSIVQVLTIPFNVTDNFFQISVTRRVLCECVPLGNCHYSPSVT